MGAQFDVLVAAFIKLGSNLAPIGAIAESAPSEMDPDFLPSGAVLDKLATAIDESRARVSQDLILDRKSTRLNSSHLVISYAVFCLKKKNIHLSAIAAG